MIRKSTQGFASLFLILAIVAGIFVLGGVGWWVIHLRVVKIGPVQEQVIAATNATTTTAKGSSTVTVSGMTKYTDSDFGFSFWYPSDWQVVKHHSGSGSFSPMTVDLLTPRQGGGNIIEISMVEYGARPEAPSLGGSLANHLVTLGAQKVLYVSQGSTESTVDPSYIISTILPTALVGGKAVSQAEQLVAIKAEQTAYAGL